MSTGWIVFGYAASYAAIVGYVAWMLVRIRSLRRNSTPRR